jgi:hypothetical protein
MVAAWVGVSGSPLCIDAFAFHSKTNIAEHSIETGTDYLICEVASCKPVVLGVFSLV